jgi:hypothetical protein
MRRIGYLNYQCTLFTILQFAKEHPRITPINMQNFQIFITLLSVFASIVNGAEEKLDITERRLRARPTLNGPYIPVESGFDPWITKKMYNNDQQMNRNDLALVQGDTEENKEPFAARRPSKRHPKYLQSFNHVRKNDISAIPSIYNERRPVTLQTRDSASIVIDEETPATRKRKIFILD